MKKKNKHFSISFFFIFHETLAYQKIHLKYINNSTYQSNLHLYISFSTHRFKGTDPLKIDQIFHFLFFCEKYTPFHPLSFGMTTITVGQREVRLAGVQRLRALSERRLSFVLTGVSFILFYLFYIFFYSPFTTLQYLIFSTINCPKTSQVAPDDTPTFEWRASVCGEAVPIVSGLLLNILLFCFFSIFETFHRSQL